MRRIFVVLCLLVSGCDNNKLTFSCKVHQVTESECKRHDEALEISELRATQAGIDHERSAASRKIGEKFASGSPSDSPYQRVKRSLERKPFYVTPIKENFDPYKIACPDFEFDEDKLDFDQMTIAMEWIGRKNTHYKSVAYLQKGNILTALFSKIASPCRPDAYTDINDEFPIITEAQLKNLKSGIYFKEVAYPGYKSINVLVFETFEEAKEKYEKLASKTEHR